MLTTAGLSRSATSANDTSARRQALPPHGSAQGPRGALGAEIAGLRRHRAGDDEPDEKGDGRREADRDDHEPPGHGFPLSRYLINSEESSLRRATGMPSVRAFSALLPGSAPTMTAVVFLLTEPATLAPRRSSAAVASSRVIAASVPVRT